jgi:hypothetical protein
MVMNKNIIVGTTASLFSAGFIALLILYLLERRKQECVEGKCPDCSTMKPVCNIDKCSIGEVTTYVKTNGSLTLAIAKKAMLDATVLNDLLTDATIVDTLAANDAVKARFPC